MFKLGDNSDQPQDPGKRKFVSGLLGLGAASLVLPSCGSTVLGRVENRSDGTREISGCDRDDGVGFNRFRHNADAFERQIKAISVRVAAALGDGSVFEQVRADIIKRLDIPADQVSDVAFITPDRRLPHLKPMNPRIEQCNVAAPHLLSPSLEGASVTHSSIFTTPLFRRAFHDSVGPVVQITSVPFKDEEYRGRKLIFSVADAVFKGGYIGRFLDAGGCMHVALSDYQRLALTQVQDPKDSGSFHATEISCTRVDHGRDHVDGTLSVNKTEETGDVIDAVMGLQGRDVKSNCPEDVALAKKIIDQVQTDVNAWLS